MVKEVFTILCGINVIVLPWVIVSVVKNYLKSKIALQEHRLNIESNIDESINEQLDGIIQEIFNTYIVFNIAYKNIKYINSEMEKDIIYAVKELVKNRLSPAMLSKLSMYYNTTAIGEIISEKIHLIVMNYVVENNEIKTEE